MNVRDRATRLRDSTRALAKYCLTTLLIFGCVAACDSRAGESDAEADRNTLIMLSALIQGSYDFRATCLRAAQAGIQCATDTGLPASTAATTYAGISQLVYNVNETPTGSTAAELCDELIARSPLLQRATAEARHCFFQCEGDFWSGARATPNRCNALEYSALPAELIAGAASCSASCLSETPRFYY